jgi:hypothetical protein
MTPLAGLNESQSTASAGAHAARRVRRSRLVRPDRIPALDDSAAFADPSRRRGSAMGAYQTRTCFSLRTDPGS